METIVDILKLFSPSDMAITSFLTLKLHTFIKF